MQCSIGWRAALATSVAILTTPALAAGSGGGSMPSSSAPQYDPAAEYRSGIEALQAGRFADADRAFGRVLAAAPRDANANYLAGLAKAGRNDLKAARRLFEKAVKYDDKMIRAHQELAVTLAKLGDTDKAGQELELLRQRAASCGESCAEAADLRAAIAAVEAAIGAGKQARIDAAPSLLFADAGQGDHRYLDAVSLINERRYGPAIEALLAAEKAFGPHPDVLTYLGFANRKLGRFDVAEAYYRKALAVAPGHRGATEYYGEMMIERGDLAGARRMLARLDAECAFGCAEAEELRRWIEASASAS